jgi:hypothetical protein
MLSDPTVKQGRINDGGQEKPPLPVKRRKVLLEECDDPNCVSCWFCFFNYLVWQYELILLSEAQEGERVRGLESHTKYTSDGPIHLTLILVLVN